MHLSSGPRSEAVQPSRSKLIDLDETLVVFGQIHLSHVGVTLVPQVTDRSQDAVRHGHGTTDVDARGGLVVDVFHYELAMSHLAAA